MRKRRMLKELLIQLIAKDSPSEENLNSDENPSSMHLEPNQENYMSDIFESESKEDIK